MKIVNTLVKTVEFKELKEGDAFRPVGTSYFDRVFIKIQKVRVKGMICQTDTGLFDISEDTANAIMLRNDFQPLLCNIVEHGEVIPVEMEVHIL